MTRWRSACTGANEWLTEARGTDATARLDAARRLEVQRDITVVKVVFSIRPPLHVRTLSKSREYIRLVSYGAGLGDPDCND